MVSIFQDLPLLQLYKKDLNFQTGSTDAHVDILRTEISMQH